MSRVLALDFGTRRIGAALSDPTRRFASPLEVYERKSEQHDAAHYRRLVEDEGVTRIVVGLPLHTSGDEGESARLARAFGAWLANVTNVPIVFHDERYTSRMADEVLRTPGVKRKDRSARRDMIAANVLLQSYLDAGCPESELPAAPLADCEDTSCEP